MVRIKLIIVNILLIGGILDVIAQSTSIVGSKHDLSISGAGPVKTSTGETSVCLFCHPPHTYSSGGPGWNHHDGTISFELAGLAGMAEHVSLKMCSVYSE